MSDSSFGGLFGDLFNILGQQGPNAWFETAKGLAVNVATQDHGDFNPNPTERQRVEQFAPLIARRVSTLFSVTVSDDVTVTNRIGLTMAALEQWRPLVQPMVDAPFALPDDDDEAAAPLAQLAATVGPLFTGFQLGSVAGHFSERAWSLGALALPRERDELLIVADNVAKFAEEWSLDHDAAAVFALAREMVATVVLTQPGTGDALRALLLESVRDTVASQGDLLKRLGSIVNPDDLSSLMGNPEALLEGFEVPDETAATRAINAAAAALRATFDTIALTTTEQLLGPVAQLREAYHRYRRADARGEDAAAALFGIDAHGDAQTDADTFVADIVTNFGEGAFISLLQADGLPSSDELQNSTAWYERVSNSPLA